ncbi:hypothetical protein ACOMHN_000979 [Nucella lapillus]
MPLQAFLEDADSVLAALDHCQAEEKCLMLIKKPKDATRKMLKSHSLSNLSVSDPQLYRQFNGQPLSHVHHPHPSQPASHKGKRSSSDEQSVASTDTERSEVRRRYISAKGKENLKQQQQLQYRRSDPEPHKSPEYYHSDSSSSVASDYRYVSRRDRDRDRDSRGGRRGDLRYSSIPEDAQEVNNNCHQHHQQQSKGKAQGWGGGVAMYHSCNDLSLVSPASSSATANTSDYTRGQGQGQGQGQRNNHHCPPPDQIASDQMYGGRGQRAPDVVPATHDPGDLEDAARSSSMGNLSTGLTLSVVGQRRADSMLDLTPSSIPRRSPTSSSSARQAPPPPQPHHRPHAALARHRSEGGPYPDHLRSPPEGYVKSPRHSYPENTGTPRRSSEDDEVFSPGPHRHPPNGFFNGPVPHPQGKVHDIQQGEAAAQGRHHQQQHHQQQQHQQQNGHAYHYSSSSNNTSREQTPQGDSPPPKPKRSLPHVPLNETSERIKRFTEMMRSRVSVCSSSGSRSSTVNSAMSQTPTTPHTPTSRQSSFTDNGSDCEVSTLLDARQQKERSSTQRPPAEGSSRERGPQHHHPRGWREGGGGGGGGGGEGREGRGRQPQPYHHPPLRQPSSSSCQETPHQLYGGDHPGVGGECGQTPFTSHSHSSTMDSGYTTNTEGDGDSTTTANTSHHHLSPPHHHHPHNHHPPPPPPQYPNHHHPNNLHNHPHHPHPVHAQPAEASPRPRGGNQSLTASRKFSSMQNVSSGPPAYPGHTAGPSGHHPGEGSRSQAGGPPSHARGPPPMRAHHPQARAQVERHRRSWDLAQNFKSLDFMPLTADSGSSQSRGSRVPQGHEDYVVKPQAVSLSGKHLKQEFGSSSQRGESQGQQETREGGTGRRESFIGRDTQQLDYSHPAGNTTPTNHTLPGHWKYSNVNNVSNGHVNINNNKNIRNNNTSNNNNNNTPPRMHPRTNTTTTSSEEESLPAPTLFQLSQNFILCSARLCLPGDLSMGALVSLTSLQVTLPSDIGSSLAQSPQGRCARLGGPGSAFRPVRTGSVGGGQMTVEMVGVGSTDPQCQQLCLLGEVRSGDLLLEVNGRQCVGMDGVNLQRLLDTTLGEVMLSLARRREEKTDNRVQQLESSLHTLQVEVHRMREEMSKKDARIRELSTMLPWKRNAAEGEENGEGGEEGSFVIGDNEFVV